MSWRIALSLLLALAAAACRDQTSAEPTLQVSQVMSGDAGDAFLRAVEPREFIFPRDHGAHPGFQTEWWYFTGRLDGPDKQVFGFQLTVFRFLLDPMAAPPEPGRQTSAALFMGHFAVTDVAASAFHAAERFSRERAGLAQASLERLDVVLEDWDMASDGASDGASEGDSFVLRARDGGYGINLRLRPRVGPVLQGEAGLSRKSASPGNASYYYSMPVLDTSGRLDTPRGSFQVTGRSWLDREWSTSALDPDQAGWDWFSLDLGDDTQLMVYRLRDRAGGQHPYSAGSLVRRGQVQRLSADDFQLQVERYWRSPHSGARYPSVWLLELPGQELSLRVKPLLEDQELNLAFRYWEGVVEAEGTMAGTAVAGRGYVELTGYE
ncbi:MAG: lipocalin-like domain-containing protein [Xanthomonadales bacterium]|nr:lipocalin-like domain-containing protein [Xanthomonadales bacterium]